MKKDNKNKSKKIRVLFVIFQYLVAMEGGREAGRERDRGKILKKWEILDPKRTQKV